MTSHLSQNDRVMCGGFANVQTIGDTNILNLPKLAFFCSVKSPGDIILKTFDYAKRLRQENITVVSGFHSPMEQECLRILLKGTQPIIICPARSIETMRIPADWKPHIEKGRMLIISPFDKKYNRTTAQTARQRNEFISDIADDVFAAHAAPDSKTLALCKQMIAKNKRLYTIPSPYNQTLMEIGAEGVIDVIRH